MSEIKPPTEAVESAIRLLYSTFAHYRPTDIAWRSPHAGISDAAVSRLQSRPLSQLVLEDLEQYIRRALSVWAGVTEFKHFLPRIFELVVRRPFAIDPLVFEKLDAAEWRTWPKAEQDAIDAYVSALWRWTLTLSPDQANAGDLLRGLGLAGYDVERWIDVWRNDRSEAATDQLAQFVLYVGDRLSSGTMPRQWHPKDHASALAFLLDPNTKARIENAFLEHPDGETGRRLADASDILAAVQYRAT